MVQEVQGSLSLHADQADRQYHGIQPNPEDLKAHRDPTKANSKEQIHNVLVLPVTEKVSR